MNTSNFFEHLCALEVELHQPTVRESQHQLSVLLHNEFYEIGYSGKTYTKSEILETLPQQKQLAAIWSQDFGLTHADQYAAMLLYKSALVLENGDLQRHALRSSLWLCTDGNWQLRFHQATATSAFKKNLS